MVRAWDIINEVATRTQRRRRDSHAPVAAVVGAGSVAKQANRISGQEIVGWVDRLSEELKRGPGVEY